MTNDTIQMKAMVQASITMVSASRSPIRSCTGTVSWQLKPEVPAEDAGDPGEVALHQRLIEAVELAQLLGAVQRVGIAARQQLVDLRR